MNLKKAIEKICKDHPEIKLVYLFGSQARKKTGPLSDHDFAFYLEEVDPEKRFETKLDLYGKIGKILKTDKIDIVILNDIHAPELKYNIIKEGKLLYEQEPYKLLLEPRILNEYFDFHHTLKKYGLTKS